MFLIFFFFLFVRIASLVYNFLRYKFFEGLEIGFNQMECFYLIKNIFSFFFIRIASLTSDSLKHKFLESKKIYIYIIKRAESYRGSYIWLWDWLSSSMQAFFLFYHSYLSLFNTI